MALSSQEIILLAIIVAVAVMILSNRLRADVVAIISLLALTFTGVISSEEAFSGFSRSLIFTIIGLFIISQGLEDTGVVLWMAKRLQRAGGGSETRLIALFMGVGAAFALVMNNIAAGAVLLPVAVRVARESKVRPSKLLIPLSFGTLVGGMGKHFTTANIIISTILVDQGQQGLGMFHFLPTGALITVVSMLFMMFIGKNLLPSRNSVGQTTGVSASALYETYQLKDRLWEVKVLPESRLANRKLAQSSIGGELGLTVLAIWRGHQAILTPDLNETIYADDYILVLGREDRVNMLLRWGVTLGRENGAADPAHNFAVDLTEVIIPPRSNAISKTLTDLRFRLKYGLTTVALWRNGRSYRTDVGKIPLEVGDALLMVGSAKNIKTLQQERDYMVLQGSHADSPESPHKAAIAVIITTIVLILTIFDIIPIAQVMLGGAMAMILTGCLDMDDAYRAIEWRVIFLIAGMLPISIAMINTGLAERIGGQIVALLDPFGALVFIAGLFIVAMTLTQVMGGQVAALIIGPIAITAALHAGIDPQAVAVAVAIGCSTAFLTPLAHPVNMLMMGSGGYIPKDFLKIGIPMTLIVFVLTLVSMTLFFNIR